MGAFSSFNVVAGIGYIAAAFAILVLMLLVAFSLELYKCLKAQDSDIAHGGKTDIRDGVIDIAKRAVLWAIGYRGEDREKTPIADVDTAWMSRYRTAIFFRFLPVYTAYILILVVGTRPVYLDESIYRAFNYSQRLSDLLLLLAIYVLSNILFDYFSIRFTLHHLMKAKKSGKYIHCFLIDLLVASALFVVSQIVSCVLWVLKRDNPSFPELTGGILNNFVEITLWPYGFVSGQGASEIVSPLFPGQLLITGTVYFPTLMLGLLLILYSVFLLITRAIKEFLISHQMDRICRVFLKVHLVGMFDLKNVEGQFRHCNYAFLALLNLSFVTAIGLVANRAFGGS